MVVGLSSKGLRFWTPQKASASPARWRGRQAHLRAPLSSPHACCPASYSTVSRKEDSMTSFVVKKPRSPTGQTKSFPKLHEMYALRLCFPCM